MDTQTNDNVIAHDLPSAVRATGLSRSKLYTYIKSGALPIVKSGRRTLLLDADLRALLQSLRQDGGSHAATA